MRLVGHENEGYTLHIHGIVSQSLREHGALSVGEYDIF